MGRRPCSTRSPAAGVTRLVFLGGGGSLEDAPGHRFIDAPDFPAQYRQTAQDQAEALGILRTHGDAITWTYVSPPPVHLIPGEKIGGHRTEARDTPITDEAGVSRISVGDYAAAALDTVEQGTFPVSASRPRTDPVGPTRRPCWPRANPAITSGKRRDRALSKRPTAGPSHCL